MGPGCAKTRKSTFRGECLSRIPSIKKELHWPVPPNEETREHNSVRSPRVHVFTQPGSISDLGERDPEVRFSLMNRDRFIRTVRALPVLTFVQGCALASSEQAAGRPFARMQAR